MKRATALLALLVALAAARAAHAERDALVGAVSMVELRSPDGSGGFERFGQGVGLSLAFLELDRPAIGLEGTAAFVAGGEGGRLYDLGLALIGTTDLREKPLAPFISVGLDMAAVRTLEAGRMADGVAVGVHGNIGLHALVDERIYLRGQVGYIGVGVGGLKGELAVGYRFE